MGEGAEIKSLKFQLKVAENRRGFEFNSLELREKGKKIPQAQALKVYGTNAISIYPCQLCIILVLK